MSCVCVDYQTVHSCGVRVQNYIIQKYRRKVCIFYLFVLHQNVWNSCALKPPQLLWPQTEGRRFLQPIRALHFAAAQMWFEVPKSFLISVGTLQFNCKNIILNPSFLIYCHCCRIMVMGCIK